MGIPHYMKDIMWDITLEIFKRLSEINCDPCLTLASFEENSKFIFCNFWQDLSTNLIGKTTILSVGHLTNQ